MSRNSTTQTSPYRLMLVAAMLAVAAAALLWRLVDLNVHEREFLQHQGDARYLREVTIPANRGMITDRRGDPLAISTPVDSVWVNPKELAGAREQWPQLARELEMEVADVERTIASRMEREFVYLRRAIDPERAQRVMDLNIPGVALQREYRRYYPAGEVTAHVVGYTNIDDQGQEGIELMLDERLQGVAGSKRVIKDRLGHIVENVESVRVPRDGEQITLALDRRIQYLAYRELKAAVQRHNARAGSVVVLDAQTGEVLAMVNQPSYNPNNRASRGGSPARNRAVTDLFEPGSTVKPFTIAAALASGDYRPDTPVDTSPGYYQMAGFTVRDARNYGLIDVSTVVQKSSNVGVSRIAMSLEPEEFWGTFDAVGFGYDSGSGFPGESAGLLKHYLDMYEVERASLSYGYGLSVTPLKLAQAYAVLASDGRLRPVSFLKLDEDERPKGVEVMTPRVAEQLRIMMQRVIQPGGTATEAAVPGYRVAGKTGTVKKASAGGYSEDSYLAVFAGFAPASRPRLVMVVMIDEPRGDVYYGGLVAAPVFSNVMGGALRLLNIAPDDLPSLQGQVAMVGGAQ